MIESFWSRMQVELLDRRIWRTRVELANAIFEYLEIFHNRQRRHSALGMLTPVEEWSHVQTSSQRPLDSWQLCRTPISRQGLDFASAGDIFRFSRRQGEGNGSACLF
jgi:hypothetical protein